MSGWHPVCPVVAMARLGNAQPQACSCRRRGAVPGQERNCVKRTVASVSGCGAGIAPARTGWQAARACPTRSSQAWVRTPDHWHLCPGRSSWGLVRSVHVAHPAPFSTSPHEYPGQRGHGRMRGPDILALNHPAGVVLRTCAAKQLLHEVLDWRLHPRSAGEKRTVAG